MAREVVGMSLETTGEATTDISNIGNDRPSRSAYDSRGIAQLAASMALEGMRHPVLVMPNGELLKGGRRQAAAQSLHWTTIPARQVRYVEDVVEYLMDTRDEFTELRTIEESVGLGLAIETLDKRGGNDDYNNLIGSAVMSSGSAYKRARYIVVAAQSQVRPLHVVEVAKQAVASIDTGMMTISMGYNRVRAAEKGNPAAAVSHDGLPATAPPSPAARSPRARILRQEWIKALAMKGATSQQIADRLGLTVSGLKKITRDIGITITADTVMARTQRKVVDPNKSMRVAIDDLDALMWSLERIDPTQLDPTEAAEWAATLNRYARGIARVSRTIKGAL